MRDGTTLRIRDSGDTDFADFSHDGTDFNITATNTTDINFSGASNQYLFDNQIQVTGGDGFVTEAASGNTWKISGEQSDQLRFTRGSTGGNEMTLTSDGAAFGNATLTIGGAAFGAADIQNWTRGDQTETVTGSWTFNAQTNGSTTITVGETTTLRGDNQDARIRLWGEQASLIYGLDFGISGTNAFVAGIGANPATDVQFSMGVELVTGNQVRWRDSTNSDDAIFLHDGTDFTSTFTGTADWVITGLTAINTNASVAIGNNNFSLTDGTDSFTFSATGGTLDLVTTGGATTFDVGLNVFASTLRLDQRGTAPTNTASTGYFWVRDDAPTTPWFTDDATGDLPLGINGMPPVAISASQNMLLSQVGKMLHKNAGGAVTLTCAQDADTWDGASWGVHNDDTEDLTITAGASVTVYWIEGGAAPVAGNVTVTQGGIVTVYKYSNTEFWVWGAKDTVSAGAIALDDLSNVVITSPLTPSFLRYNGTNWIDASLAIVDDPSPQLGANLDSNTFDIDMADNDFVTFGTGRDVSIGWDGTDLEITGLTNNQTINVRDGHHIRLWDATDTDWLDIHNNGANIVLTESGLGNINFPSTPLTFGVNMNDNQIQAARLKDYSIESEAYTPTGTTQTLTYSTGPAFEVDLESVTGNITMTLSGGPPSGTYGNIIVKVTQDSTTARTITWAGGTFEWAGGTAHVMTTTLNGFSIYTFETWDGGTTWFGAGEDYS